MKVKRVINSYAVKITDEPFLLSSGQNMQQTARLTFRDVNQNIIERKKYGVSDINWLYEQINHGEQINLSQHYVKNFSSNDYRNKYKLSKDHLIKIKDFNAKDAFFEADRLVDFSLCEFIGENTDFSNSHFGSGNLSFYQALFQSSNVDFSNTSYSEGNNSFQYARFGDGNISFENASFINGNISFINTYFGNGDAIFKNINFGNGNVNFSFASFGKGVVSFDRSAFNGLNVDFSKVEFGSGRLYFRRTDFGNAEVSFREIEHSGSDKVNFRRAKFGDRSITFNEAIFHNADVLFDEAEFNKGNISFLNASAKSFSFSKCLLSNYMDLRVSKCQSINLSHSIIRDIIDLKPGIAPVHLGTLYIHGIRLLGEIFISWDENNTYELIHNQKDTTIREKAEQFRILKENFRSSGNYNDEDKAYVQFKRYELQYLSDERIKRNKWNKIWDYPLAGFKKIIFDLMGLYATSPIRVLISIVIVNICYGLLYICFLVSSKSQIDCIEENLPIYDKILDSFYFSAITFFTIGYGDCTPSGFLKIIAPIEGFTGVFLMSYFTVAFVRKILR